MFRPLTPALVAVAAVLLTACSDNPLGPRSPLEYDVPGGILAGPGNAPADPVSQNPDAGDTGAPATNDPSDSPDDSTQDSGNDTGDQPGDDGKGGDAAGSETGSQDTGNQNTDSPNTETGSQDTGSQDSSSPDTGSNDSSSQDSTAENSGDSNTDSSSSSTPPAGSPSGQQGGSSNGGNPNAGNSNGGNPNGGNGVSTPVSLGGTVQVEVPGGQIIGYRSSPQPAAAGGFCGDGTDGYPLGTWVKTTPGNTSVHANHTHCVVRSEAATITVSFAIAGTYVVTPSGNLLLNVGTDRNIHYIAQQNATKGQGVLLGQGSDGSVWELDLSQVQHAGHTRPAVPDGINPTHRRYTSLTAVRQGGATLSSQVTLAW